MLNTVLACGGVSAPRGQPIIELLGYQTIVEMRYCRLTNLLRKTSPQFMCAEAHWILSGSNKLEDIVWAAKNMAKFSDDGQTLFGAYGPKIADQIDGVIAKLANDQDSRQAVINIWRENPPATKDMPCTLSAQWFIRGDHLHCVDTMRSSDAWLGWPNDIFTFSMVSAYVLLRLRELGVRLKLGHLFMNAGSQHIYMKNHDRAQACLCGDHMPYEPLNLDEFKNVYDFMDHLYAVAHGLSTSKDWMIV